MRESENFAPKIVGLDFLQTCDSIFGRHKISDFSESEFQPANDTVRGTYLVILATEDCFDRLPQIFGVESFYPADDGKVPVYVNKMGSNAENYHVACVYIPADAADAIEAERFSGFYDESPIVYSETSNYFPRGLFNAQCRMLELG